MKTAKMNWSAIPQITVRHGKRLRLFERSQAQSSIATSPSMLTKRNAMPHLLQVAETSHVPPAAILAASIPLPLRGGISKTDPIPYGARCFYFSFCAGQENRG